ncbi:MAG: alpha/beta fold hydrolase [Rubrobacteraceae bacterium]
MPGEIELAFGKAGEGTDPIVALHGITSQHRAFNAAARYLASSRGIVGMDLRGRGDSGKPDSGYGLEAHAADVICLLDHLGLERAVICGHSMGAFVALHTAISFPNRVEALVLLDGGWPRIEVDPKEMTAQQKQEAEAIGEGLKRSFGRLDTTFESPDAYLDFWFPDQDLKLNDLPPDLADYYRYDLGEVEGSYQPKASSAAAGEDAGAVASEAPTAEELKQVKCPVALVRPSEGFFPGTAPLISPEARVAMGDSLDLRSDTRLEGANHYTILWPEYTRQWVELLSDDSWYRS